MWIPCPIPQSKSHFLISKILISDSPISISDLPYFTIPISILSLPFCRLVTLHTFRLVTLHTFRRVTLHAFTISQQNHTKYPAGAYHRHFHPNNKFIFWGAGADTLLRTSWSNFGCWGRHPGSNFHFPAFPPPRPPFPGGQFETLGLRPTPWKRYTCRLFWWSLCKTPPLRSGAAFLEFSNFPFFSVFHCFPFCISHFPANGNPPPPAAAELTRHSATARPRRVPYASSAV